jgi:hypothetical protein
VEWLRSRAFGEQMLEKFEGITTSTGYGHNDGVKKEARQMVAALRAFLNPAQLSLFGSP